jgi:hypothetical protein
MNSNFLAITVGIFIGLGMMSEGASAQSNTECEAEILQLNTIVNIQPLYETNRFSSENPFDLTWNDANNTDPYYEIVDKGANSSSTQRYEIYHDNQFIQAISATGVLGQSHYGDFIIGFVGKVRLWEVKRYFLPAVLVLFTSSVMGLVLVMTRPKSTRLMLIITLLLLVVITLCTYLGLILSALLYSLSVLLFMLVNPLVRMFFNGKRKKTYLSSRIAFVLGCFLVITNLTLAHEIFQLYEQGMPITTTFDNTRYPSAGTISKDDRLLVLAADYPNDFGKFMIEIFDVNTGDKLVTLEHNAYVTDLFWTDDSTFLISTDVNEHMVIWGILPSDCSILENLDR